MLCFRDVSVSLHNKPNPALASDGVVIAYFYVVYRYLNDKHHFRSVMTDNVKLSTFITRVDNLPNKIASQLKLRYIQNRMLLKIVIVSFIYLIIGLCIIFSSKDC